MLLNVLDIHAPFTSKKVKGKPSPWLDAEVKQHMNARDKLLRKAQKSKLEPDWNAYRKHKNFVTNLIKRTKRNFLKNKLEESRSKPEKFWKTVKEVFPVTKSANICTKSFKIEEKTVTDKKIIAEGFCKFFANVATTLKKALFPLVNFAWRYNQSSEPNVTKFKFNKISESEVLKHLKKLKRKYAKGLDNLPSCYLKDIAYVLAKLLTHVINLSLQLGTFPSDLKKARATPVYKSGAQNIFDNCRPISVLPVISKVFEKCVHAQIMNHLESNKLLLENQFRFRKYLSTEIATVYFTDQIRKAMDNGQYTGAVYIDLSKAFDAISHSILINTLPEYGISGKAQDWLCDYLFSRSQQVSFQGKLSSAESIFCGVP